jgi:hypothetical protein
MAIADILSVRKRRLSLQREVDLLEQEEKGLVNALINDMNQKGENILKEGEDEARIITTFEPDVQSWPLLLDYIRDNNALDMLQKRVTASAVKARWSEGEIIPGVEVTMKQVLKFNI